MNSKDIRTVTYTNMSRIRIMRLTHMPTETHVEGEGKNLYKRREELMHDLSQAVGEKGDE